MGGVVKQHDDPEPREDLVEHLGLRSVRPDAELVEGVDAIRSNLRQR